LVKRLAPLLWSAVFLLVSREAGTAQEQSNFLTLPFDDARVVLLQGWLYTTDYDFSCSVPGSCAAPAISQTKRCHRGIDYATSLQPPWDSFAVVAAAPGRAVVSFSESYGRFVYIAHEERDQNGLRYFTLYAHLQSAESDIPFRSLNQLVADVTAEDFSGWIQRNRGDVIGRAGESGLANGVTHLHFEVQRGGYPMNKADPYNIYGSRDLYRGSSCCPEFLWTQCPPVGPAPTPLNQPVYDTQSNLKMTFQSWVQPLGTGLDGTLSQITLRTNFAAYTDVAELFICSDTSPITNGCYLQPTFGHTAEAFLNILNSPATGVQDFSQWTVVGTDNRNYPPFRSPPHPDGLLHFDPSRYYALQIYMGDYSNSGYIYGSAISGPGGDCFAAGGGDCGSVKSIYLSIK